MHQLRDSRFKTRSREFLYIVISKNRVLYECIVILRYTYLIPAMKVITNCRKPMNLIEDRTRIFLSRSISSYLVTIIALPLCQKVARRWISHRKAQTCLPLLTRLETAREGLCIRDQTTHLFWRSFVSKRTSCDDKNGIQYYRVHDRITVVRFKFLCDYFIGSSVDCNNIIL